MTGNKVHKNYQMLLMTCSFAGVYDPMKPDK